VSVAEQEPAKLAALEGHFRTERGAPLRIGGLPDVERQQVPYALEIPGGLSFMAFRDFHAEVKGLDAVPRDEWPPVREVHVCFQLMVGAGLAMAALAGLTALLAWRRRGLPEGRGLLRAWVAAGPLGVVALEAGWMVTELGRQPWIVRGALRTKDAVTPFPYLAAPFWTFTLLYVFLGVTVAYLLYQQIYRRPLDAGAGGTDGH
jgi:cytochrome d ubiquinol oxidase subunit I